MSDGFCSDEDQATLARVKERALRKGSDLGDIKDALARIEAKLDKLLASMDAAPAPTAPPAIDWRGVAHGIASRVVNQCSDCPVLANGLCGGGVFCLRKPWPSNELAPLDPLS